MSKIIFVHLFDDFSGSPKVLSHVMTSCQDRGVGFEAVVSDCSSGFISKIKEPIFKYYYKRSNSKLFVLINYMISQLILFFKMFRFFNEDVVVYVNTMLPFGACLAAKVMKKKVFVHVHETTIRPKLLKKFLRMIISFTASKIIFVSEYLKKEESFSNKVCQIVVYNSLDLTNVVRSERDSNGEFICLMACSLKEYKGVFEFVELSKRFHDCEISFVLVLNASQIEIDDFFSDIVMPKKLTIYATQIDMSKHYERSSVLLNLSRPDGWVETFGMTILEGMAYGLPVIVPNVGGPLELVDHGVNGYIESCYNLDSIVEYIQGLYSSPDLYQRMSDSAFVKSKCFSYAVFSERIFKEICQ